MHLRFGTAIGVVLLLSAGIAAPASASEVPPSSLDSLTQCDGTESEACPLSPAISAITATQTSLTVAWTWGEDTPTPADVSHVILRVTPGDIEKVLPVSESSAVITGLEPNTEYTLTAQSAAGNQLGIESEPFGATTLNLVQVKPTSTPGPVENLIVTLKSEQAVESTVTSASSDLPIADVSVTQTQDLGSGNALVELSSGVSDSDAQSIIDEIKSDPNVASVEFNKRVFLNAFPSTPPNDTEWVADQMWGLYGTYGVGIAADKDTMNAVWNTNQGSGTVVAVLDTGSTVHPDLDSNYVAGYDFVSSASPNCRSGATNSDGDYVDTSTYGALGWDNNPLDPGDWTTVTSASCGNAGNSSWHGTHVAGTIAAVTDNGQYVAGVAPLAQIQPVRVLSFAGGGSADIIAGISWASGGTVTGVAANATPADVINMSLGGLGACPSGIQTSIDAAIAAGSVVVVSAGNSNAEAANYFPANCTGVISVAALTSTGARASYSNYGASVDIAAPGSGIYSTMNTGATLPVGPTVASYNGTSMAAPHVAGVAALIKSVSSAYTPAQVLGQIQSAVAAFPTGTGNDCTTSTCGSGVLRAPTTTGPGANTITPSSGTTAGGTSVVIGGWNLTSPTSVTFDGVAATVTASSLNSITATTPAGSAGAVNVVVTTAAGSSTLSSGYTYATPTPPAPPAPPAPSSGGGSSSSSSESAPAPVSDEITVTEPPVLTNQVSTPGAFSVVNGDGTPVALRAADLTPNGFTIAGSDWGVSGTGALNSANQTLTPGNVISLQGENLQRLTTVGIYILSNPTWVASAIVTYDNDFTTSFAVPALPAGEHTLQINVVRQGGAVNSLALGFTLAGSDAATPGAPIPDSPTEMANLIVFKAGSATLTKTAKIRLKRMANSLEGNEARGTVTSFVNKRGTAPSTKLAAARTAAVKKYLKSQGLDATVSTNYPSAPTKRMLRSSVVLLSSAINSYTNSAPESVSSLIVRYRSGVSPSINGKVRGINFVTADVAKGLTLGTSLGLRMYTVDFAEPVSMAIAQRTARQISRSKGVEFAELNLPVSTNITTN